MPEEINICKMRNLAIIDYDQLDTRIASIVRLINSDVFGIQTSGFYPANPGKEKPEGMFALACTENAFRRLFSLYEQMIQPVPNFQLIFTQALERTTDKDGDTVREYSWPVILIKYFPQNEEIEKKQLQLLTQFFQKLV
jgi:hypothetical protein